MSKNIKKHLGKGLAELINMNEVQYDLSGNREFQEVNIDTIEAITQPRYNFDQEALNELASSIKQHGILQPILVREEGGKFIIIAGERRWRAAKLLNIKTIPIICKKENDNHLILSIIENTQRTNLSPVEEAKSYKALIDKYKYTQEQVAELVSKSRSYITNSLRILNLPQEILLLLDEKRLSQAHAKLLLSLDNPIEIANKIINNKLSVRKTEKIILHNNSNKIEDKNIDLIEIEMLLSKRLNMDVKINTNNKGGKVIIDFKNDLELDKIVEKLTE